MATPELRAARKPIIRHLESVVTDARVLRDGRPYEIGHGRPSDTGVAICTVDGHLYSGGDAHATFALQSISKPLTYALALMDHGTSYVDSKINVEPSGEAFNEISLHGQPSRPANPMVNVGAIATAWLVKEPRFERITTFYEALFGHRIELDDAIYAAEVASSARNRALAWLLTSAEVIEDEPLDALDAYLRQCSVLVTAEDLAVVGATLANRGKQPITGEQVMSSSVAERVLSVMSTCGMYDDAGEWMIRVGMPAKSGVGGGILASAPGQLGVGTYAPPLDQHGNSVRGTAMCERLSQDFDLHFARVARPHHSTVRRITDIAGNARLVELQGDLAFMGIEAALHAILTAAEDQEAIVVDMTRVNHVVSRARDLLHQVHDRLEETGHRLLVIGDETRLGPGTWCADVDEALARIGDH